MKKRAQAAILVASIFAFAACSSVEHYEGIDAAVASGDFSKAYALVKKESDDGYAKKDRVLYHLDAGLLAHYAGLSKDSYTLLGKAERGIEAAFTKSVTQAVASYLVNDNTKEYPGEDYEDIYLNAIKAIDYYKSGSLEGAMVEIRRIDNKLKFLSTKYGTSVSNAQKAALEKGAQVPVDPDSATVRFNNSALARWLSMLFYRGVGRPDDARIDRDQVKLAFANQRHLYPFPVPSSLDEELSFPRAKARLNVLCLVGLSPIKEEHVVRIPLDGGNWVKVAVPGIVARPSIVARSEVSVEGVGTFPLETIEDISAVAVETFKQRAALIYFKTIVRSIAKTASSIALDEGADDVGGNAGIALKLFSLGAQVYAEASEQADLRLSRYFPARALVGGITVDPGRYTIIVRHYNKAGRIVHEERFPDVEVLADRLNLMEAVCIK